jgi:serine/arginine repetitive matrix protein 2
MQPRDRGRRHQSSVSIASPISLYNCSYGVHRRSDSNTSVSPVAHSYALYGTNGGRAAWARHRQDTSVDSVQSDFSVMCLGHPGIGDKMFNMAVDQGKPLTSISASPLES